MKEKGKKSLILLFWLAVWQGAAIRMNKPIFLVGPLETIRALLRLASAADFWKAAFFTLGRISGGFALAFLAGLLLGTAAYFQRFLENLLSPVITAMKTIPVASFVILALLWAGPKQLALIISFLVVFPMIYLNTLAGLRSTDPALLEMCQVFGVGWPEKVWNIYRPALSPFLLSASQVALGMSWKSGIAAEVIGTPDYSIGEKLYMAKIYFSTDELLAWTITVIFLSFLFEKVIFALLKKTLEAGHSYCLTAPSGGGKTTLLRLFMGLEQPDEGRISGNETGSLSVVFQEDRLCPELGAEKNILLTHPVCTGQALKEELLKLLPADCLSKPVREFSGGMRRRVALLRAMLHPGKLLLMDEPFNGLDEQTRRAAIEYVKEKKQDKILVLATHHEDEAKALGAQPICWKNA